MNPFRNNEKPPEAWPADTTIKPVRWMLVHDALTDKIVDVATGNVIAESKYDQSAKEAICALVDAANLGARLMVKEPPR